MNCTACGCERIMHNLSGRPRACTNWVDRRADDVNAGRPCPCPGYSVAVLPSDGARIEFGVHRQEAPDAESAPAWTPLGELRRSLDGKADRSADAALKRRTR